MLGDVGNPSNLARARSGQGTSILICDGGRLIATVHVGLYAVPCCPRACRAGHPTRAEAVGLIALSPGPFGLVLDCARGAASAIPCRACEPTVSTATAFSRTGGDLLFTSEQAGDTSDGVIGILDVDAGYARIGESQAEDRNRHEPDLMPDQGRWSSRNGGIGHRSPWTAQS